MYVLLAIAIAVLLIVAIVLPIVAFARTRDMARRIDKLSGEVSGLSHQLSRLDARFGPDTVSPTAPETLPESTPEAVAEGTAEPGAEAPAAPEAAEEPPEPSVEPEQPAPAPSVTEAVRPEGRGRRIEEQIGSRLAVLLGGLAIALGAIFLVRYTIEQGLIGPAMRIALGGLLAIGLFASGELLRRRGRRFALPVVPDADIPSILTGTGGVAAFATIYSAYALYGFLPAAAAFVLLTLAGTGTMFLSAVHGPALAALGIAGSFLTPVLVSTGEPAPMPLAVHTLFVAATALGLARIRDWKWLAVIAVGGSLFWCFFVITTGQETLAPILALAGLSVLFTGFLAEGIDPADNGAFDQKPNELALVALAGTAVSATFYLASEPGLPSLMTAIVLSAGYGAAAARWSSLAPAALLAAALTTLAVIVLDLPAFFDPQTMRFRAEWAPVEPLMARRLLFQAAAIALVPVLGGFLSADRAAAGAPRAAGFFAGCSAGAAVAVLIAAYFKTAPYETRPAFGLAGLILAFVLAAATQRLLGRQPDRSDAPAPALMAAGSVSCLAFACMVGLERNWIAPALALSAAGIAWIAVHRPVFVLRPLAAVTAFAASLALADNLGSVLETLGPPRIFNGLILTLALPAAVLLAGGEAMRRKSSDIWAAVPQIAGLVIAALFVALEIRHLVHAPAVDTGLSWLTGAPRLLEFTLYSFAALAIAWLLGRVAVRTGGIVYERAARIAALAPVLTIAAGHIVFANPLLQHDAIIGGWPASKLVLGYPVTAGLVALVSWTQAERWPPWLTRLYAVLSLLLVFATVTLLVRFSYHGPAMQLVAHDTGDLESWTYSIVWLGLGIALLAAGAVSGSLQIRAASGVILLVTIVKVFAFDMAVLTGLLRALSFLGLGLSLLLIGWFYQRFLTTGTGGGGPDVPEAPAGDGPAQAGEAAK